MTVDFDVDQAGWGSSTNYPDNPSFTPRYIVVHWGGNTSDIVGEAAEQDRLRRWQNYHINGRGWRDIAYNFAVGDTGTIYRCRGYNPGGHTSTVDDRTPEGDAYNVASLGVVWIGGAQANGPSDAAIASMRHLVATAGNLEVKAHSTVKQENGSNTACPGDTWRQIIEGGFDMDYRDVANVPDTDWARQIVDWGIQTGMIITGDEFPDDWNRDDMTDGRLWTFLKRFDDYLERKWA